LSNQIIVNLLLIPASQNNPKNNSFLQPLIIIEKFVLYSKGENRYAVTGLFFVLFLICWFPLGLF